MVCLDRFRRPDDDCSCIARNDCFDTTFMKAVNGLNAGESFEDLNRKNIKSISRGGWEDQTDNLQVYQKMR